MAVETEESSSALEWMMQLRRGALSTTQRTALSDWLRESPTHVRSLLELMLLDHDLRSLPISLDQMNEWLQEARDAPDEPIPLTRAGRPLADDAERSEASIAMQPAAADERRVSRMRWGAAAAVAVAVLGALSLSRWEAGRYATGLGEQRVFTLADGSVVSLNTQSALKVDLSSNRRAITLLKGEAFFRVAHDASRPFEVQAGEATVRAVGTQFNVRMAAQATVVSVLDGTVEVREAAKALGSAAEPAFALRITKGEETQIPAPSARLADQSPLTRSSDRAAQRAAAWTQGRVDFDTASLIDVIAEFQRYQTLSVQIDDRATEELKLTGSFDVHDPDSALAYVATIPGIVVEKQGEHAFRIRRSP